MTTRHSSRLTTHLGAIALALAASQAGATTYSVPLQFTLNLTAPVCSLTVGSVTADATTPTPATGVSVNLTPTPLSTISTPVSLLASIPNTSTFSSSSAGLYYGDSSISPNARKLDSLPTAFAICTTGTPMTASITKGVANSLFTNNSMAAQPGSGQVVALPIGMRMGIVSFGAASNVITAPGSTAGTNTASIPTTATGTSQAIVLAASLAASSTTPLTASHAGDWYFPFTINLDF